MFVIWRECWLTWPECRWHLVPARLHSLPHGQDLPVVSLMWVLPATRPHTACLALINVIGASLKMFLNSCFSLWDIVFNIYNSRQDKSCPWLSRGGGDRRDRQRSSRICSSSSRVQSGQGRGRPLATARIPPSEANQQVRTEDTRGRPDTKTVISVANCRPALKILSQSAELTALAPMKSMCWHFCCNSLY